MQDGVVRTASLLVALALIIAALSLGAPILLPVFEALIVWFMLNGFASGLRRLPGLGPRLSEGMAITLAVLLVLTVAVLAIYSGVRGLVNAGPQTLSLQSSLDPLIRSVATALGADEARVLDGVVDAIGLENFLHQIVLGFLGLLNQFGIIAIFVAFIFADQAFFPTKMRLLFPDEGRRAKVEAILSEIKDKITSYLWIMTKVSALTAGLSYLVMLAFGLNYPMFWAVLIFLLNFIPTIGSILGTALPVAFALVQYPDLTSAMLLLVCLGVVQTVIGNVVFPRLAGDTLNLSLFVTILALFVWGALWGVTGMLIAVPLTSIIVIVLSQFEGSRPVAIVLSKTGDLGTKQD